MSQLTDELWYMIIEATSFGLAARQRCCARIGQSYERRNDIAMLSYGVIRAICRASRDALPVHNPYGCERAYDLLDDARGSSFYQDYVGSRVMKALTQRHLSSRLLASLGHGYPLAYSD